MMMMMMVRIDEWQMQQGAVSNLITAKEFVISRYQSSRLDETRRGRIDGKRGGKQ